MRGAMQLPFVALLALAAIHAEEVSTDIPKVAAEESILRVRSLPAISDVVNENNWTSLSDTLDIFSARNLVRNWADGEHAVGAQCAKDITTYLEALKKRELWALKGELDHCGEIKSCWLLEFLYCYVKNVLREARK